MQNITLEITIPVSSDEEKMNLLARYFSGDLQKVILNSVSETEEKGITTDSNTQMLNSKMDSILELLAGMDSFNKQKPVSTEVPKATKQEEVPSSQQQLKDMLKAQELPERQKPTTGLFSKKSIRRV